MKDGKKVSLRCNPDASNCAFAIFGRTWREAVSGLLGGTWELDGSRSPLWIPLRQESLGRRQTVIGTSVLRFPFAIKCTNQELVNRDGLVMLCDPNYDSLANLQSRQGSQQNLE